MKRIMPSPDGYQSTAERAAAAAVEQQEYEALIGLPNKEVRAWVENRLTNKIQRSLASVLGRRKITVTFVDLTPGMAAIVNN